LCCFIIDKKASREAKVDKKLALGLGVKRKQLKKKKGRVLDGAVESECAAGHGTVKGIGSDCFL
jgi:ribosomal RNA-processing protein 7